MNDFFGTGFFLPEEGDVKKTPYRIKRILSALFSASTTALIIYFIAGSFVLSLSLFGVLFISASVGLVQIGVINIAPRGKIVFGIVDLYYGNSRSSRTKRAISLIRINFL